MSTLCGMPANCLVACSWAKWFQR